MDDVNYNDNTRIIIQKDLFEKIILDINNKYNKYTFLDLNDYILFLKIITNEKDEKVFEKVENIKKKYKNYNLTFDINKYYNDLLNVDILRYKAIKYFSDIKTRIITYYNKNKNELNKLDINSLICILKFKIIKNIEFTNNIEYDMINKILYETDINKRLINKLKYEKKICINHFNNNYKILHYKDLNENKKNNNNYKNIKKVSLFLGGSIALLGLAFMTIPTIFGISALGPISGGLFSYFQSIGITLSIIQSISMTGISFIVGTCCISGASIIILPGLAITYKEIMDDVKLYKEFQKYVINYINNEK